MLIWSPNYELQVYFLVGLELRLLVVLGLPLPAAWVQSFAMTLDLMYMMNLGLLKNKLG